MKGPSNYITYANEKRTYERTYIRTTDNLLLRSKDGVSSPFRVVHHLSEIHLTQYTEVKSSHSGCFDTLSDKLETLLEGSNSK